MMRPSVSRVGIALSPHGVDLYSKRALSIPPLPTHGIIRVLQLTLAGLLPEGTANNCGYPAKVGIGPQIS